MNFVVPVVSYNNSVKNPYSIPIFTIHSYSLSTNRYATLGKGFARAQVRYVPAREKVLGDVEAGIRSGAYTLSLGVFNPFNEVYYEPTDPLKTPLPGRSLYLSVRANL